MVTINKNTVSALNNLIQICRDGELGYRTAAEKEKGTLSSVFLEYSEQRSRFVRELQNEVERLGEKAEDSGTAAGALHRGWFEAKTAASGDKKAAIVSECERGEDAAVKSYREALKADLPGDVRALIERQYSHVKEAHDRMRTLELQGKRMGGEDEGEIGSASEGAPD